MKMVMIQDGPMPTGADKPLRISGDPFKVQVRVLSRASRRRSGWSVTQHVPSLTLKPFVRVCVIQQARELVAEIIRDKDQGDFRTGRLGDFGSRLGGTSLDVSAGRDTHTHTLYILTVLYPVILSLCICARTGGSTEVCCGYRHRQKRRDDQKDPE